MESFAIAWWAWLAAGLVLFALEALTPGGFYVIFFAVGAAVTGLLAATGLLPSLVWQGVAFVALSLISLLLFREPLLRRFQKGMPEGKVDDIVGETAKALNEIPSGGTGTAELRGASWNAHNVGPEPIAVSARCKVERIEGLTLYIRAQ
jgi:inner membrane protein